MHLIKCQASFKCCNDSNGFCRKFYILYQDEVASACWKTNVALVTVMIWFQKESVSMKIVSDNKHHDKRAVVSYSFTVFTYVKEMFGESIQNINIWTDMAHLVNLRISLSLATLVIRILSCFFIIIIQHGIIQLQVMERGGFRWSRRHHKMIAYEGNHVWYCRAVI